MSLKGTTEFHKKLETLDSIYEDGKKCGKSKEEMFKELASVAGEDIAEDYIIRAEFLSGEHSLPEIKVPRDQLRKSEKEVRRIRLKQFIRKLFS